MDAGSVRELTYSWTGRNNLRRWYCGSVSISAETLIARAAAARSEGRFDLARDDLRDAIAQLRSGENPLQLADAVRRLGEVERSLAGGDHGAASYQEAIEILRNVQVPLKLAHAVRHLADLYRHQGELGKADDCYAEALSIYEHEELASPLDVANTLRGIALLNERTGFKVRALAFWLRARTLYEAANVESGVNECTLHERALDG